MKIDCCKKKKSLIIFIPFNLLLSTYATNNAKVKVYSRVNISSNKIKEDRDVFEINYETNIYRAGTIANFIID